jgi:low molecular weight phosphotyrosine protein phosphatase
MTCTKCGVPILHRARQVREEDFYQFDYLLAMDTLNLEDLQELAEDLNKERIGKGRTPQFHDDPDVESAHLFGEYRVEDSKLDKIVRDPYYG